MSKSEAQAGELAAQAGEQVAVLSRTPEGVRAAFPEVVAQLEAAAVAGERRRLAELVAAFPGDAAAALDAAVSGQTADQAKSARYEALAAELAKTREQLAAAEQQRTAPGFVPTQPDAATAVAGVDVAQANELRWRAEWDQSPTLQAEFGEFKTYAAYQRNHHPKK